MHGRRDHAQSTSMLQSERQTTRIQDFLNKTELSALDGWKVAQATYGQRGWQLAHGAASYSDTLPAGWSFQRRGTCSNNDNGAIAKILTSVFGPKAVSFAHTNNMEDLLTRAKNAEDAGVIDEVQDLIGGAAKSMSDCIERKLGNVKATYVIGHGLGGGTAVSYYHQQGGRGEGTLSALATVLTYGAPPTGPDMCEFHGTRYLHANDPIGSSLFGNHPIEHEVITGRIYDDTSRRRRHHVYERRRASTWQWTDDCERKSTGSFSSVQAVLGFHNNYDYS